ncbi:MAG: FAD-dependent oxidoreductase [Clostridiales bacterium]|nr:FAD-dependent oxidoreductase [Clostridiales bacterium]
MKVLIVGGVAGGASAAARLRRLDEGCEIIVFERGEHISYANCGLPYYIGGVITEKSELLLQTPQSFKARFNVDVRVKNEVIAIDPELKSITVRDLIKGVTYSETYDKLILSMGAKPVMPPIEGIESERVFSLRDIPDTFRIKNYIENNKPSSALVAGGGYIGIEMAENLRELGMDVNIMVRSNQIFKPLDYDLARCVQNYMSDKGVGILLNSATRKIEDNGRLTVTLSDRTIETDMLIMATGVTPETELARDAGIELDSRGAIVVDSRMRTNKNDIYAVGDAVEVRDFVTGEATFVPLAGPANKQGRIAADNICGIPSEYTGTQGTAILKVFDMTVATTGLNERTAKAAGIDFDKTCIYSNSHADYYPGATRMLIKVLWDKKTEKIIGAQIAGFDGVDKRMDVLATAIRFGAKVTDLTRMELCYAPPYGSAKDPVNMIGFVAENIVSGKMKQFFWDDVATLQNDENALLLDVRTNSEVHRGVIEGSMHIPLHHLRENIERLPNSKRLYVYCDSGLRSYIACRILSNLGYDTYNLAGGYRLYQTVVRQGTTVESSCPKCGS